MEQTLTVDDLKKQLRSRFPACHPTRARPRSTPTVSEQTLRAGRGPWPTGIGPIDDLLPGGGFPGGRISDITGAPSSGKLMAALGCAAQATRAEHPVAWVDLAGTFYPPSAEAAGVDLRRLLILRPRDITGALKAVDILLRGRAFPVVILDWGLDPRGGRVDLDLIGTAIARLNGLLSMGSEALVTLTTPQTARDPIRYYASFRLELSRVPFQTVVSQVARGQLGAAAPSPDGHPSEAHPSEGALSAAPQTEAHVPGLPQTEAHVPGLPQTAGLAPGLPSPQGPTPGRHLRLIHGASPGATPEGAASSAPQAGGAGPRLTPLTAPSPREDAPPGAAHRDGASSPWGMSAPSGGSAIGGRPGGAAGPSEEGAGGPREGGDRLSMRRSSTPSPQLLGARSAFEVVKNKLGAPGRNGEVSLEPWESSVLPLHSGRMPPGPA